MFFSNNPVVLVFLKLVHQDFGKNKPDRLETSKPKANSQGDDVRSVRNRQRWWLYAMLMRNPSLIPLRGHNISVGHRGFVLLQSQICSVVWSKTFAEIKGMPRSLMHNVKCHS
jgi:hypothetical protein